MSKDHVTTDLLIERWDNIVVVELECRHDILHFRSYRFHPEIGPRLFINSKSFLDCLREFNAKLMTLAQ